MQFPLRGSPRVWSWNLYMHIIGEVSRTGSSVIGPTAQRKQGKMFCLSVMTLPVRLHSFRWAPLLPHHPVDLPIYLFPRIKFPLLFPAILLPPPPPPRCPVCADRPGDDPWMPNTEMYLYSTSTLSLVLSGCPAGFHVRYIRACETAPTWAKCFRIVMGGQHQSPGSHRVERETQEDISVTHRSMGSVPHCQLGGGGGVRSQMWRVQRKSKGPGFG